MSHEIILIVEDDPTLQLIAKIMMEKLGRDCEVVGTGEAALEKEPQKLGLIFMDVGLPGIDGIEATTLIRKREASGGLKRVPIIAITGHGDRESCLRSGMDDYLQKPAMMSDFEKMLAKWLHAR
jgi:CheY-like chemotaxis protein